MPRALVQVQKVRSSSREVSDHDHLYVTVLSRTLVALVAGELTTLVPKGQQSVTLMSLGLVVQPFTNFTRRDH